MTIDFSGVIQGQSIVSSIYFKRTLQEESVVNGLSTTTGVFLNVRKIISRISYITKTIYR